MDKLVKGVLKFQQEAFVDNKALFDELATGQSPEVLFITCADSRIDPHLITQTMPGDLFVCRNAGNIVPPYPHAANGMTASIEFAVTVLGVKHIVICGHSDCGAMKGALAMDTLSAIPNVKDWLEFVQPAVESLAAENQTPDLKTLTEENVLLQLENLKSHPAVAAKLDSGELSLHAWVYDIGNGGACCSHPEKRDFQPIAEHYDAA
ncbi:Carbonic anhydrase 1 [BD1-7 clade bacterium]|uniref:Carbonic anhydrase n=1 Tax=BD1-7 clade bacterium TaxID=2029982 RepID=A0A5S9PLZ8_9GAMM|nr:Carbonic anhydrase 1 [BD1-7 clade bacterium]